MTGDPKWLRYDAAMRRLSLRLHVQPNAKKTEITGLHGDALKVRVAAPPADGKANGELLAFLAKAIGVPRSAVTLRHGATSRRKVIEMTGGPELLERASALK